MKHVFAVTLALGLVACASVQTQGDYDQSYDFAALQTWDWMPEPGLTQGPAGRRNPIVERRIQDAVGRELAAKGYRQVPGGNADFRVAFFAAAEQKLDVSTTYDYYGYRWRGAVPHTEVREYTQGTLVIDIVDESRNELVWRGTGTGVVGSGDPDDITRRINEAVSEVLKDFPPGRVAE